MNIINLYSKRNSTKPQTFIYDQLPEGFTIQICYIWSDFYDNVIIDNESKTIHILNNVWKHIHDVLCREHKKMTLVSSSYSLRQLYHKQVEEYFLSLKNIDKVLDVIELTFIIIENFRKATNFNSYLKIDYEPEKAIEHLNQRFSENGLGFQYKDGKVLKYASEHLFDATIKPALNLLNDPLYKNANDEFLNAFDHFRHNRYEESLTECLKAFESTMKIICDKRGWPYNQNDTAKPLINICIQKGLVPTFSESHLAAVRNSLESGIPTLRNKGGGHGKGTQASIADEQLVNYCINLTASTILFFIESERKLV